MNENTLTIMARGFKYVAITIAIAVVTILAITGLVKVIEACPIAFAVIAALAIIYLVGSLTR